MSRGDEAFFSGGAARAQRFRIEGHSTRYSTDLARGGEGTLAETLELGPTELVFRAHEELAPGAELRLGVQIPFKRSFVRAVGRVEDCRPEPDGSYRVTVRYSKLLAGNDEALFDTLLRFLSP